MQIFVTRAAGPKAGQKLTLEVEGTHTVEEVHAMITAAEGIPAAEQCLLLGEGEGVRLERGMTMEDYEVRMETALRLIPQRRPPPHRPPRAWPAAPPPPPPHRPPRARPAATSP